LEKKILYKDTIIISCIIFVVSISWYIFPFYHYYQLDFETTKFIGGLLLIPVKDEDSLRTAREKIEVMLQENSAVAGENTKSKGGIWKIIFGIYMAAAMAPLFHHLWFLHYLFWLVLLFAFAMWCYQKSGRKWRPRIVWLVPLAVIPQLFMVFNFGPDTATGIVLWLPKIAYYAVFFGVGALFFGRPGFGEKLKSRWPVLFAAALPLACVALYFFHQREVASDAGVEGNEMRVFTFHAIYSIAAVAYAWLMIFAMIGVFRCLFPSENPRVRYLSDASYWLYIAHLPLMFFIQIGIAEWQLPALLKLLIICAVTVGILLFAYEFFVRYTFYCYSNVL
jgi:peptidoglycan/LPS O-acetylase OafA/YrhL